MMGGDYDSLKEAAEGMIKKGSWIGLNPHKVKRLCEEYTQLKEKVHQNCETISTILKECDHEPHGLSAEETEEYYFVPESMLLSILEDDRKALPAGSERSHDEGTLLVAYKKGFEDAKKQILEKLNKFREEVMR